MVLPSGQSPVFKKCIKEFPVWRATCKTPVIKYHVPEVQILFERPHPSSDGVRLYSTVDPPTTELQPKSILEMRFCMFITIDFKTIEIAVELNTTVTAGRLWELIPFRSTANRWGSSLYFDTPLVCGIEQPTLDVSAGDVAYWPGGQALMIFFGPTPLSEVAKPLPPQLVTVIGRISGESSRLAAVDDRTAVSVHGIPSP